MLNKIKPYISEMRPRQYPKNFFIFAPMLFDRQFLNPRALLVTGVGFIVLCLLSSGVYTLNDLADVEADRKHPRKKGRPIASGQISIRNGKIFCVCLFLAAYLIAYLLKPDFLMMCLIITAVNLAYTFKLKHLPIIDVMTIGILFILRVRCGATLTPVKEFSPWIYIVTFMLAMYLGFGKRRAELASLSGTDTRPVLDGYTLPFLDQLITILSAMIIISYALYSFSGPAAVNNSRMLLSLPCVVYGVFRYLYLIEVKHQGGAPEEILLNDRWLQGAIILYALSVFYALYL